MLWLQEAALEVGLPCSDETKLHVFADALLLLDVTDMIRNNLTWSEYSGHVHMHELTCINYSSGH